MSENVAADERRQKAEIPFRESQLDAADQAEDQARKLLPMLTDVNKASHKLSRRNWAERRRGVPANGTPSGFNFRDGSVSCWILWGTK